MHPSGTGDCSEKKGLHLKKSAKGTKNDIIIYSKPCANIGITPHFYSRNLFICN